MEKQNKDQKQEVETCGAGCGCGASGSGGRCRWIAGVVILVIAGALVARAMVKNNEAQTEDKAAADFAALPAPSEPSDDAAAKPEIADALNEIASFAELNTVAMGSAGVFIYVPGKGDSAVTSPVGVMRGAARTIEPRLHGKMGLFALKAGSPDYEQIAGQMPVPGVIALVPGGRMVPVTGEITETKLVQGFVGSVQSCGVGGCGPNGCN